MNDPIEMLKSLQGAQSRRKFAQEIGISAAYLCDVLNRRQPPGPAVLAYLGLERTVAVTYKRQRKRPAAQDASQ